MAAVRMARVSEGRPGLDYLSSMGVLYDHPRRMADESHFRRFRDKKEKKIDYFR